VFAIRAKNFYIIGGFPMRYLLSFGLLALVVFSANSAVACSCAPPPPPKKALEVAEAVFLGKVIKIEKPGKDRGFGPITVTFEVSTNYKGVKTKQVKVRTASSGSACGYGFAKDISYLVYCYSGDKGKTLSTGLCSRTRPKKNAKADIEAIGPGSAVTAKNGP
jgi:hypothetical protein